MKLVELTSPDLAVVPVRAGGTGTVLEQLVRPLVQVGRVADSARLVSALLARERAGSTGIGEQVAVPHALCEELEAPAVVVGVAPEGVEYHAPDAAPVQLFFLLVSPPGHTRTHIRTLARIARLARSEEFRAGLLACGNGAEVVAAIEAYEREHV